jgi:hypothetical protein
LDEIYDLCIYDPIVGQPFQSAVQLFQSSESQEKMIWLWGLSKVTCLLLDSSQNFQIIFFAEFFIARCPCCGDLHTKSYNTDGRSSILGKERFFTFNPWHNSRRLI